MDVQMLIFSGSFIVKGIYFGISFTKDDAYDSTHVAAQKFLKLRG